MFLEFKNILATFLLLTDSVSVPMVVSLNTFHFADTTIHYQHSYVYVLSDWFDIFDFLCKLPFYTIVLFNKIKSMWQNQREESIRCIFSCKVFFKILSTSLQIISIRNNTWLLKSNQTLTLV